MDFENNQKVGGSDYVVDGVADGAEVLAQFKEFGEYHDEKVVYGVYNNADQPLMVKINDFMVDHSKVTLKDKSYFFHMLAVMVDAGIPVVAAVRSLANRSDNPRFRRILNTISYNTERGSDLSSAMSRFEDVFDEAEIGIVKSGEATGRLHIMLFKLSAELDSKHDLSLKLWGASIYPIAVLTVLLFVTVGMLVWVFPTLLGLLKEGGIDAKNLPISTKILMGIQSAIVNYWWLLLAVIFVGVGFFKMYTHSDYGAVRWDAVKLRIPILGGLLRKIYILRFVSLLGLLMEAGLPVIKALQITGGALTNRLYKLKTQEVINSVRDGGKISGSLQDVRFLFPPEVVQMLRVGENSASLGSIATKVSDQYNREINNSLKKLSAVFEPVMILVVGVFVALLAMAVMAPIFNLTSAVGA